MSGVYGCKQGECPVRSGGRCLEGLDKETCPYSFREVSVSEEGAGDGSLSPSTVVPPENIGFRFHSGLEMEMGEALHITLQNPTRIVVVGGSFRSGKTSLIAAIYEKLMKGDMAAYCFAGSLTLLSFERICKSLRIASGLRKPKMERTELRDKLTYLHIRVARDELGAKTQDILLANAAGELFTDSGRKVTHSAVLDILPRADHFVYLIDGKKLTSTARRHLEQGYLSDLLLRLITDKLLSNSSFVDVVFSKWDVVQKDAKALSFASSLEREIEAQFGEKLGRLRFFRVAPLPEQSDAPPSPNTVDQLLACWAEEGLYSRHKESKSNTLDNPSREASRLYTYSSVS